MMKKLFPILMLLAFSWGETYLELRNVDFDTGHLDIWMENDVEIAGFQFDLTGITITDAGGGIAAENGFIVSSSATTIIGFSITGSTISPGAGTLVNVSFTYFNIRVCMENLVLSDADGNSVYPVIGECVGEPPISGCMDSEACNFNPEAEEEIGGICDYGFDCWDGSPACFPWECPPEPIYGCTNPEACNYDPIANENDGSCQYGFYCWNGINYCEPQDCPANEFDPFIQFGNVNNGFMEILLSTPTPVSRVYLAISNIDIIDVIGGLVIDLGFEIDVDSSSITAFSSNPEMMIQPGENWLLFALQFNGSGNACFEQVEIFDQNNNLVNVNWGDCIYIGGDAIYGCTENWACNYDQFATTNDGSCKYWDDCGNCDGDGYLIECLDNNYCDDMDCSGSCGGAAEVDMCSVCDTFPFNNNECFTYPFGLFGVWSSAWVLSYDNPDCSGEPIQSTPIDSMISITLLDDSTGVFFDQFNQQTDEFFWGVNQNEEICTLLDEQFGGADCIPYNQEHGMMVVEMENFGEEYECADGDIEDCYGNCAPEGWVGDGVCDNGSFTYNGEQIFLDCEEWYFDNGDCSRGNDGDDDGAGGCEDGFLIDCSGDGDCCAEGWIGDGWPDCEDQQWGCDLSCYENDGGDCAGYQNSDAQDDSIHRAPKPGWVYKDNHGDESRDHDSCTLVYFNHVDCFANHSLYGGHCFYDNDLTVLTTIIQNSQESVMPPPADLEPPLMGNQIWRNGRLFELCSAGSEIPEDPYCNSGFVLSGRLPASIGELDSLAILKLPMNNLTDTIPSSLFELSHLEVLWLSGNQFTGEISPEIGNLQELKELSFAVNQFQGDLPDELYSLQNLSALDLSVNNFDGELTSDIGNLTNLNMLRLRNNNLTGYIPEEICSLTQLEEFSISNNSFCPPYPTCIQPYVGQQSCILGCLDESACNFNPQANYEDNSCAVEMIGAGGDEAGNDCAGTCQGNAWVDECGGCSGGQSGHIGNSDLDCNGDCFGAAWYDGCNLCVEGNSGEEPCNLDCMNEQGGQASYDDCGICSGGSSEHDANSDMDCFGICDPITPMGITQENNDLYFGAVFDECGYCAGGSTGFESDFAKDCNGVCDGDAYADWCDECDNNPDNDNELDQGCGCLMAAPQSFYLDADGDGFGVGIAVQFCDDPGEGWSINDEDENDFIFCTTNQIDNCDVCNGDNSSCNVPTVESQSVYTQENIPIEFNLSAEDPNGIDLSVILLFEPAYGELELVSGVTYLYNPGPGFIGNDNFSYQVTNGEWWSDAAEVSIFVSVVDDPPVAYSSNMEIFEDQEIIFNLLATDTDSEDSTLQFEIVQQPLHGSLNLLRAISEYSYLPHSNYFGVDSLKFRSYYSLHVGDTVFSPEAVVSFQIIAVNDPPVLTPASNSYGGFEDQTIDIQFTVSDPEGDATSLFIPLQPTNGVITETGGSQVTYTPFENFNGSDQVMLVAQEISGEDPLLSNTEIVNIFIASTNDAPIAYPFSVDVLEDNSISVPLLGSDVDGDNLVFSILDSTGNGSLSLMGNILTFTPEADFNGSDQVKYIVSDPEILSDTARVYMDVYSVNDMPSAEMIEFLNVASGFTFNSDSLIFSDPDGDDLEIVFVPSDGSTIFNGSITEANGEYTFNYGSNGAVDYLFYKVRDEGSESPVSLITFNASATRSSHLRSAPVIVSDTIWVMEDNSVTLSFIGAEITDGIALDNSAYFEITADGDPVNGTLVDLAFSELDGQLLIWTATYIPNQDFSGFDQIEFIMVNPNNTDNFESETGFLVLEILPINDPPTALNIQDYLINEDDTLWVPIDLNAIDPDSDIDVAVSSSDSENVESGFDISSGNLIVIPAENYNNPISVHVSYTEATGDSLKAVEAFQLNIQAVNDAPVMVPVPPQNILQGEYTTVQLLATDVDGDTDFTYSLFSGDDELNLNISSSILYINPDAGISGEFNITVFATDGTDYSQPVTFSLNIEDITDPPSLPELADPLAVGEDGDNIIFTLIPTDPDVGDQLSLIVEAYNLVLFPEGSIIVEPESAGSGYERMVTMDPAPNQFGTSLIKVTVDDGNYSVIGQINVEVTSVNDPPVLADVGSLSFNEDESLIITLTAWDVDNENAELILYATGGSSILIDLSGTQLTFSPEQDFFGTENFTITVHDGSDAVSEDISVEVLPINDPPEIVSTAPDTAKTFVEFAYQLNVEDVDGDSVQYSLVTSPPGMEITSSGLITWTPQWGVLTSGTVNVWASDGEAFDIQTFTLAVLQADCEGVVDGDSLADDCNVCSGDGYFIDCFGNGNCVNMDCAGICFGDAIYQPYYYDGDGDGEGSDIPVGSHCSAEDEVSENPWVPNSDDEDDNCFSNNHDECSICDGDGYTDNCTDTDDCDNMDCNSECGGDAEMIAIFLDEDSDGLGNSDSTGVSCSAVIPEGWVTNEDDTDDNCFSNVHDECDICDGDGIADNCIDTDDCDNMDCNGDCGGEALMTTVYEDSDGDDDGNPEVTDIVCSANIPEGWVLNSDDEDDNCFSNIHDECSICDGDGYTDNCTDTDDCDNMDCNSECGGDAEMIAIFLDEDSDGLGNSDSTGVSCSAVIPEGWVTNEDDTDDNCFSNVHDDCDICDGDGYTDNCTDTDDCSNMDCNGECGGDALLDSCSVCSGGNSAHEENSDKDYCDVCFGANECIPVITDSQTPDGMTISLQSGNINISFSTPLLSSSSDAVTLSSFTGSVLEYTLGVVSDTNIQIELLQLTSRDTIELTIQADMIVSAAGDYTLDNDDFSTPPGSGDDNIDWTIYTQTLGDYNGNDEIDGEDIDTLLTYWNEDVGYELGPFAGTAPHLTPAFDDQWNIDDLMAFILMWNWSSTQSTTVSWDIGEDYGIAPLFNFSSDILQLTMPDYDSEISHIEYQLNWSFSAINYTAADLSAKFAAALSRESSDGLGGEWHLLNFNPADIQGTLSLGELTVAGKDKESLEIFYKISSKEGLLSRGSLTLEYTPLPAEYEISQAYPNPFNPKTSFNFGLPIDSRVQVKVFDLNGRLVSTIINGFYPAGYHKLSWDGSGQASGLYFVEFHVQNTIGDGIQFRDIQKIMMVK